MFFFQFNNTSTVGILSTILTKGVPNQLQWRHNDCDDVSNHQPHDCSLNHLCRRRSKKIHVSKLCVTGLCEGGSPVTGEFPAQRANNAENFSIWWHHHAICTRLCCGTLDVKTCLYEDIASVCARFLRTTNQLFSLSSFTGLNGWPRS